MSKRYKLMRDLPGIPAGTEREEDENGILKFKIMWNGEETEHWYDATFRKNFQGWFHDLDTPEPDGKTDAQKWEETMAEVNARSQKAFQDSQRPSEPTIAELIEINKAFRDHVIGSGTAEERIYLWSIATLMRLTISPSKTDS